MENFIESVGSGQDRSGLDVLLRPYFCAARQSFKAKWEYPSNFSPMNASGDLYIFSRNVVVQIFGVLLDFAAVFFELVDKDIGLITKKNAGDVFKKVFGQFFAAHDGIFEMTQVFLNQVASGDGLFHSMDWVTEESPFHLQFLQDFLRDCAPTMCGLRGGRFPRFQRCGRGGAAM